jgi:hypothetical protein
MALRWKLLIGIGTILISLGLFIDWPRQTDPSLPDTKSFFLLLGGVDGVARLVIGLTTKK